MTRDGAARTAGAALAAVLGFVGWLVLAGGVLFALIVGFYEIVGYGDSGPHLAWEDIFWPGAVLAAGAALIWARLALRRAAVRPPPSAPPPG